jgi:hypothetical protein
MKKRTLSIALATLMIFSALIVAVPSYAGPKEDAIAAGMATLAGQQNADGSWGTEYEVAKTGFAVLKFETHAIENNIDPFDPAYDYSDEIQSGLNYIFNRSFIISPLPVQTHGDPDTDGDGQGVYFVSPVGNRRVYETGIAMMAIAHSTHPGMVVDVPGSAVDDWKYEHVVEDAVDYMAFAQVDFGTWRGGWSYTDRNNADGTADNSNTGYAVLGLGYARASPPGGFGLTIPAFVYNEVDVWVEYIQCKVLGTNYGGSGYTSPSSWVNMLKTGNLLYEMWFVGDTVTTPRVMAAIDYLKNHWNDTDYIGWKGPGPGGDPTWPACYQTMYCIMKGLEAFAIEEIDGFDWQADFETALIAQQCANGSWPNAPFFGASDGRPYTLPGGWAWDTDNIISTEWVLLTLEKAVPPPPPPTLQDIEDKLDYWLPEIKLEIVMIEEKLDFWLPEIKAEIVMIEDKIDNIVIPKLDSIKEEVTAIEYKLDYIIDKETVEVEILTGKQVGVGTQILKNKFVYWMMTTVAGQKVSIDQIEIEAGALTIDPSDYAITEIKTGVYKIEIDRHAVPNVTKLIVIQVQYTDLDSDVVYHGAAITTAFTVGHNP